MILIPHTSLALVNFKQSKKEGKRKTFSVLDCDHKFSFFLGRFRPASSVHPPSSSAIESQPNGKMIFLIFIAEAKERRGKSFPSCVVLSNYKFHLHMNGELIESPRGSRVEDFQL
jgi:hypothetical protein